MSNSSSNTYLPANKTIIETFQSNESNSPTSEILAGKRKRSGDELITSTTVTKNAIRTLRIPRKSNKVSFDLQNNNAASTSKVKPAVAHSIAPSDSSSTLLDSNNNDMDSTERKNPRPQVVQNDQIPGPSRAITEPTQMEDPDEEYMVIPRATDIWLLMKKHHAYEQRHRLRAAQLQGLMQQEITPMWAIRRDQEQRPQFLTTTPEQIDLARTHARELCELTYVELLTRESEDHEKADDYEAIVRDIYRREVDPDIELAMRRCEMILAKYRAQEQVKLNAATARDTAAFPKDDREYIALLDAQSSTSGTSRRRRSRSTSRDNKRRREASNSIAPRPPPSPSPPRETASSSAPANKQAHTANRRNCTPAIRQPAERPTSSHSAQPTSNPPQSAPAREVREYSPPSRGRSSYRGGKGGHRGRGNNRGRGRGHPGRGKHHGQRPTANQQEDDDFVRRLKGLLKSFK